MKINKVIIGVAMVLTLVLTSSAFALGLAFGGSNEFQSRGSAISTAGGARVQPKEPKYKQDETTEVLVDAEVANNEIVRVRKHGDHWHVYTKDGREIITYTDPSKAKNTAQLKGAAKVVSTSQLSALASNGVVKILKHGDHYHVYTADGREFITYSDPRSLYPGAAFGTYNGSHGNGKVTVPSVWSPRPAGPSSPFTPAVSSKGNKGAGGSHSRPAPGGKLPFVSVVSLQQLAKLPIVKILQHGDHYHAYTKDGQEYITYDNPVKVFPRIKIGQYAGSHSGSGSASKPDKGQNPKPDVETKPKPKPGSGKQDPNDPERVVRIERHGDHWHLHFADGHEGISYTDPSALYPDIKITEYQEEKPKDTSPIEEDERFTYDEVEAKLIVPLKYITYGNVTHATRYDQENQRFVIPHYDHYHYMTLDTIIQFAKGGKDNMFHGYSARQVVATLKYLIMHPEARPKGENGWGSAADIES